MSSPTDVACIFILPDFTMVPPITVCGADPSLVEMVEDRPGHDRRYSVDAARVRALGWTPAWGLDEGLAATVDWYRDNRRWWKPLRDRDQ